MRLSWDDYFLKMAETACLRSTCLRAQFGAVLVKNHTIISTGYNGAASGVRSCLERGNASATAPYPQRRKLRNLPLRPCRGQCDHPRQTSI